MADKTAVCVCMCVCVWYSDCLTWSWSSNPDEGLAMDARECRVPAEHWVYRRLSGDMNSRPARTQFWTAQTYIHRTKNGLNQLAKLTCQEY